MKTAYHHFWKGPPIRRPSASMSLTPLNHLLNHILPMAPITWRSPRGPRYRWPLTRVCSRVGSYDDLLIRGLRVGLILVNTRDGTKGLVKRGMLMESEAVKLIRRVCMLAWCTLVDGFRCACHQTVHAPGPPPYFTVVLHGPTVEKKSPRLQPLWPHVHANRANSVWFRYPTELFRATPRRAAH